MNNENCTAIDKFRQIKKEIRGDKDYLIVGIDIAKDKHFAFLGYTNGKTILKRLPFDNTQEGYQKLLTRIEEKKQKKKFSKIVLGVEPTANYHKPLSEFLISRNYSVVLVSTGAVKHNRELLDGRWDKNDPKDSANVADLISLGKCLYYDHTSINIRELRGLYSLRKKMKKMEQSTKVRLRNQLVAQFFPELDGYFKSFESGCLSIMDHCFDPMEIAGMDFEDFKNLVMSKNPRLIQLKKLRGIWEVAQISIGCKITDSARFEASLSVQSLKRVRDDVKKIEKQIENVCRTIPEYILLLTIPGFGPIISAQVVAAIGEAKRFMNGKQVLKMAGLDLSASFYRILKKCPF